MAKKKLKTSSTDDKSDDKNFDFEESLGEVEGIVSQLEGGELGLTASLQKYEQGIRELKQCQTLLDAAEQKISQLSGFDADGNPVSTPQPNTQTAARGGKTASRSKKSSKSSTADTPPVNTNENASSVDDSPGLF
ncbi:MAG: exodeoxyribonuclease VII small subunit [Rubripirellula sp.]|nr:exodeoxyribonuclease VII small subunit [Rhodopirellula sp.]MCH1439529.1 exodeoxyribonuclease VII small subunit [Rubripirellula sp.]OUX05245.1 MAG: exodeoxyribonuclease VII small subunit [Planctomycetaceae bacterium TMED240]